MTMSGQRVIRLAVAFVWLIVFMLYVLPSNTASALGQITVRKLTLEDGAGGDGGSKPGGTVKHKFDFTIPSTANVGSIKFEYCTTAHIDPCVTPTGLDTTGATLTFQGTNLNGFTLVADPGGTPAGTNGAPYITRTAAAPPGPNTQVSFELSGVVNPTVNNESFYVRITTYQGEDGATSPIDNGVVAASTATPIQLNGYMPESLVFCTGGTIGTTVANVPDCGTASSGNLTFPDFSPSATSYITSQMAASTNAQTGYAITVSGATLTSGSNTINAISTADTCKQGTSQFGLNLVQNTDFCGSTGTTVGANVTAAGGSVYNGRALSPYDTDGTYKFTAGSLNSIADSNSTGTDAQIFTISYIVNVPGSQPAGTYDTTLTYICTPTY